MAIPSGASHTATDDELDFSDIEAKYYLFVLSLCFRSSSPA
jgi:hypothetical protein